MNNVKDDFSWNTVLGVQHGPSIGMYGSTGLNSSELKVVGAGFLYNRIVKATLDNVSQSGAITMRFGVGGTIQLYQSKYNKNFNYNTYSQNGYAINPNSTVSATDSTKEGNGSSVKFYYVRGSTGAMIQRGIAFYDSLAHALPYFLSQGASVPHDKGFLITAYDGFYIKNTPSSSKGNLASEWDKVTTGDIKSKPLTITGGTTPAMDFENGSSITIVVSTTANSITHNTATITNIKDGGRYNVRFKALHTSNTFVFPSNVYRNNGTAMGSYSITNGALDFICIGTDLYCTNY